MPTIVRLQHVAITVPTEGLERARDFYSGVLGMSNTSLGFGMNLQAGLAVAATKQLAIDIGADYHPGTDTLNDMSMVNQSSEYLAVHVGAALRL